MSEPTTYEIVLRGRAGTRILWPLIDDFVLTQTADGNTQLVGKICDPSHFHGILAHLTSVNAEVISLCPYPIPLGLQTS
ncbi:hypothetical protein K0U73_19995 [bacterium]|jgi:hypothetical protein|nr:hypothetical protein [bacterium]MDB4109701.1 hypothetical protein [bacterium]MDC0350133.1 hypothetical protein [bacterium]